jgi:hypothetical protein
MSLALTIPPHDLDWLHQVAPRRERERVQVWVDILKTFESATDKGLAVLELCERYAGSVKLSKATIYRQAEAVQAKGWTGLLRKKYLTAYLDETNASSEMDAFIAQCWKPMCESSQRVTAAAYRSLILDHLIAGKTIPGYETDWRGIWRLDHKGKNMRVPESCPYQLDKNYPRGWSRRNLYRLAPDKYELTATRIGIAAAKKYLPSIPTTRVGLPFARVLMIDDVFHDVKVRMLGNAEPQIVVEMRGIELLTGSLYTFGVKPVRERADETREHLQEDFTRYLIADVVVNKGYCPQGLLVCGEKGTAKLPADLMVTLRKWGGETIEFEAGGIVDTPLARGLLAGRGKGNPQFKSAVESAHSLMKNEVALIRGQKGADPEHSPEDYPTRLRQDKTLMKICHGLLIERPDLCDKLRGLFPSYYQYLEFINLVYDRIDHRTDHHLEGFEEVGFVKGMWRISEGDSWKPESMLDEMPPATADNLRAIIQSNPRKHYNFAVMSPAEAQEYCRQRQELIYFPSAAVPDILGRKLGNIAPVGDDDTIHIKDKYIAGKIYPVAPIVRTLDGRKELLPRGSKWLVHINPFNDREAYISTPEERFVGIAKVIVAGSRIDREEYQRNIKILSSVKAAEAKRLSPIADQRLKELYETATHDVELITGTNPIYDAQEIAATNKRHKGFKPVSLLDDTDTDDDLNETEPAFNAAALL